MVDESRIVRIALKLSLRNRLHDTSKYCSDKADEEHRSKNGVKMEHISEDERCEKESSAQHQLFSQSTNKLQIFSATTHIFVPRYPYFRVMSASPRVFVTGVSGYVGGHTVMRIIEKHPEWTVVALVRNEEQNSIVHARWHKIETVIGDLDDKKLMIKEGSKADVVLRMYLNPPFVLTSAKLE